MRRKSIHEIRELRTSIDHSLVKPPKLQRQQPRRSSIRSYKEDSDSDRLIETEEGAQVSLFCEFFSIITSLNN